jgi:hypothetical protein
VHQTWEGYSWFLLVILLRHYVLVMLSGSSLYGILSIDGDVLVISWTELFYRKVVGFSPKVVFPRIKSCVLLFTVHG